MKKLILVAGFAAMTTLGVHAQFTPGSIVVLRGGDGHADMSKKQGPAYFDQFNPTGANQTPTFSDGFPTNTANGATLFFNGQAGSEGGITRAADRTTVTFSGYTGVNMLQVGGTPSKINIPRGFTSTDYQGTNTIYTSAQWFPLPGGASPQSNPRSIATDGTNNFWGAGSTSSSTGNVLMKWNPTNEANPFPCTTFINAVSAVGIAHNVLFATILAPDIITGVTPSGITQHPPGGIYDFVHTAVDGEGNPAVGDFDPFPQVAGGTADLGNLVFAFQAPYTNAAAFAMNEGTNICYVADSNLGIQKYTNNGAGTWSFAYNLAAGPVAKTNAGCYGVIVDFSGPHPVIFATTTDQSAANGGNVTTNRIIRIDDTNALAIVTTLATAPTNEVFRGIAFAPDLRPLILAQPTDLVVDTNQTATFTVSATSPYALSYQWLKNGTNYSAGATSTSLSIPSAQFSDDGNYSVIVSNSHGAVTSSIAKLVVGRILPFFVTEPAPTTNFVGETAVFSAVADGTPTLTYQWFFNSAPISGQTANTLVLSGVDTNNAGAYYLAVTNPLGFTNSITVNLSVRYKPVSFVSSPSPTTVITNSTVTLNVAVSGSTNFTYQWTRFATNLSDVTTPDGSTLSGTTTDTLTINNSAVSDSGDYAVIVSNPAGPATSGVATVSVIIPPAPSSVSYDTTNTTYFQDFNTLPNPGEVGVNTGNPISIAGITYSLANPYDFAFPVLRSGGIGGLGLNTLSGWYASFDKGSKLGAHDGDNTTGGVISYGLPSSSNRSLGLQATSTTGRDAFGVKIVNNTGVTLDHITFHFTGEYWRQQNNYQLLELGMYVDPNPANTINTNSITDLVPDLNVAFPSRTGAPSPLDGTQATNQLDLGTNDMVINNWTPGSALWLVWQMDSTNSIAGGAQGFGIDNFSFAANAGPVRPTVSVQPASAGAMVSWPAYVTGYSLQENSALDNPAGWTTVSPIVITNGQNTFTVPASGTNQFFRLISGD